jgi:hypothetical protein
MALVRKIKPRKYLEMREFEKKKIKMSWENKDDKRKK